LKFHHSTKWSVSRDDVHQKVKQQMTTQKFVVTVIWGIDGCHIVDLIPEEHSHNMQYFVSNIMEPPLCAVFPYFRKPRSRRLSVHLDNCCAHGSKASDNFFAETVIVRVPHQLYSPDLTLSNFCLVGYMKGALAGPHFVESTDLLNGIQVLLGEIQRCELEQVSHHWTGRM
jgi:hypothetical protein